ncbi:MAG: T9SS type A sorting domain-containing protein [Chitinophagales bacterium]
MKKIIPYILFLFCCISITNVQAYYISYIKYKDGGFQFLVNAGYDSCHYVGEYKEYFFFFEADKAIQNFPLLDFTQPNEFKTSKASFINLVNDTAFIKSSHIDDPVIVKLDTITSCDPLTSICNTDTLTIEYGNVFKHEFWDYIYNKNNNSIYTKIFTLQFNKELTALQYTDAYLIKKKPTNSHNFPIFSKTENYDYDSVYACFRLTPYLSNTTPIVGDNDTILLFDFRDWSYNDPGDYKFMVYKLDADLNLVDSALFIKNKNLIYGTVISPRIVELNDYIYVSLTHMMISIPEKYEVWKFDKNLRLVDSMQTDDWSVYKSYFLSEKNKNVIITSSYNRTDIKIINNLNDTVHSFAIAPIDNILISRDTSFIILKMELIPPDTNYVPIMYVWDKEGTLINRFNLRNLPYFKEIYFPAISHNNRDFFVSFYAIDSFDNIAYYYSNNISSYDCPTNPEGISIGVFNLHESIVSAVKNNTSKIKSTIYPNPFTDKISMQFEYQQPSILYLYSLQGNIIQKLESATNSYTINRNNLPAGMYLYQLRDKNNNSLLDTGKIIAQ